MIRETDAKNEHGRVDNHTSTRGMKDAWLPVYVIIYEAGAQKEVQRSGPRYLGDFAYCLVSRDFSAITGGY